MLICYGGFELLDCGFVIDPEGCFGLYWTSVVMLLWFELMIFVRLSVFGLFVVVCA